MARLVFVQDLRYEIPAVMALSAALRQAGHEPWVVFGGGRGAARRVARARPDVVGLTLMTYQLPWARELVRALRAAGVRAPILAGGIHPTLKPETLGTLGLDAVLRGEGDAALPEAVEALAAGREPTGVAGFCVPGGTGPIRPLLADLDALPFLDRSPYDHDPFLRRIGVRVAVASRGCPFRCAFCANPHVKALHPRGTQYHRTQSVERTLDEVEALIGSHAPNIVRFMDDIFGVDPDWLARFLAGYRGRNLRTPFQFNTHADVLPHSLIPELKRTGCVSVSVGLESGDEMLRTQVLGKRIPDERFRSLAAACRAHGLAFNLNTLYGLPGETLQAALATVALTAELRPNRVLTDILKFYPGLQITERAIAEGRLAPEDIARLGESAFKTRRSLLRQPEIRAVENVHKLSHLGASVPALLPAIRRLARLPPNPLFDALFYGSAFFEYFRGDYQTGPLETALRLILCARAAF